MDPKYLAQLATIVQLGSVTKAARRLNITQPSLSRSIKIIEDRVGAPILRRGRYGVTPTEIGERLAQEGRIIVEHSQRAWEMVFEWKQGLSGEFRVGIGPLIEAAFFGDFLVEYMSEKRANTLKVYSGPTPRLMEQLDRHELDLVISPAQTNKLYERLSQSLLLTDRLSIFGSVDDPLASSEIVTMDDLRVRKWVSAAASTGLYGATRESLEMLGIREKVSIADFSGGINSLCKVVREMHACCVLPIRIGSMLTESFGVTPFNTALKLPARDAAIWTELHQSDRPEILEFVERFQRYVSELP
ncbi:MAG: LysR family transcriptional regulator [Pseudomonadota bacterium]